MGVLRAVRQMLFLCVKQIWRDDEMRFIPEKQPFHGQSIRSLRSKYITLALSACEHP